MKKALSVLILVSMLLSLCPVLAYASDRECLLSVNGKLIDFEKPYATYSADTINLLLSDTAKENIMQLLGVTVIFCDDNIILTKNGKILKTPYNSKTYDNGTKNITLKDYCYYASKSTTSPDRINLKMLEEFGIKVSYDPRIPLISVTSNGVEPKDNSYMVTKYGFDTFTAQNLITGKTEEFKYAGLKDLKNIIGNYNIAPYCNIEIEPNSKTTPRLAYLWNGDNLVNASLIENKLATVDTDVSNRKYKYFNKLYTASTKPTISYEKFKTPDLGVETVDTIKININGKPLSINAVYKDKVLFAPLVETAYALGAETYSLDYMDPFSQKKSLAYVIVNKTHTLELLLDQSIMTANNQIEVMENKVFLHNNNAMVPVSFFKNFFNVDITFSKENKTITIKNK